MPQVSVIIPNFNHARFLDKRIQSVLDQTFRDFEIIYLDDASTDGSAEVFARYAHLAQIRAVCNGRNGGSVFKQWNRGIREARGQYIWIAESDDYADPRFLERLVEILEGNSQIGVAYCQSHCVDENDLARATMEEWTRDLHPTRWRSDFQNCGKDECRRYLSRKNTLPNASAILFRKRVYEQSGGADETWTVCGDWACWFNCLWVSDVAFVAEPLNFFRTHTGSVREGNWRNGLATLETLQMLDAADKRCQTSAGHRISARQMRRACRPVCELWIYTLLKNAPIPWRRHLQTYRLMRRLNPRFYLLFGFEIVRFVLLLLRNQFRKMRHN